MLNFFQLFAWKALWTRYVFQHDEQHDKILYKIILAGNGLLSAYTKLTFLVNSFSGRKRGPSRDWNFGCATPCAFSSKCFLINFGNASSEYRLEASATSVRDRSPTTWRPCEAAKLTLMTSSNQSENAPECVASYANPKLLVKQSRALAVGPKYRR